MGNIICKTLGHRHEPISIGTIRATNDTITIYACARCMTIPTDSVRQKIERKRMRRGERITA